MRYTHNLKDAEALELTEGMTQARELYVQKQKSVTVKVHMDSEDALPLFNELPMNLLPPLPIGHQWVSHNDTYSVIRDKNAIQQQVSITLFGPSHHQTPHINFLCQVNGNTTYSFAKTIKANGPSSRAYPMTPSDFHVNGYNYIPGETFQNHMRGHLIDHQDTIMGAGLTLSTKFAPNYVPEPPVDAWGKFFRNHKIKLVRKKGGYYTQHNEYDDLSCLTVNGTLVPSHARLYTYDNNLQLDDIHHASWTENLARADASTTYVDFYKTHFISCLTASSVVQCYEPGITDRALRVLRKNAFKTMLQINSGDVSSRFSVKDQANSACEAANLEVTSTNCLPTSALKLFDVARSDKVKVSTHEMKRSLYHVDKLLEIDGAKVYSETTKAKGIQFFHKLNAVEHGNVDVDSLEDHFKQNCSL